MAKWNKWLWGGLGWAMYGPIGGIMGYAMGSLSENRSVTLLKNQFLNIIPVL